MNKVRNQYLIKNDKVRGKYINNSLKFPYKYNDKYSSWINVSKEHSFAYIRKLEKLEKIKYY